MAKPINEKKNELWISLDNIYKALQRIECDNSKIYRKGGKYGSRDSFWIRIFPDSLKTQKITSGGKIFEDVYLIGSGTDVTRFHHASKHVKNAHNNVSDDNYYSLSDYFRINGKQAYDEIRANIDSLMIELFASEKENYAKMWADEIIEPLSSKDLINDCGKEGRLYSSELDFKEYLTNPTNSYYEACDKLTIMTITSLFPYDSFSRNISTNIVSIFESKIPKVVNSSCIRVLGSEVPDPKHYRYDEYSDAFQYLNDSSLGKHTLLITGQGGDGKTTMASWLYSYYKCEASKYYAYTFWVNYDGNSLKDSFLQSFDISSLVSEHDKDNANLKDEYKIARILEFFQHTQKRILLVIDNVNSISERNDSKISLFDLLQNYPYPLVDVVITSRSPKFAKMDWVSHCAKKISLSKLTDSLAHELFRAYYIFDIADSDNDSISNIVKLSHNNILLIELLAKAAKTSELKLNNFARKLNTIGFELPKESIRTNHSCDLVAEQIRKLYNIEELCPKEKGILYSFAIINYDISFLREELDFLIFNSASKLADSLVSRGWLTYDPQHGYAMHDIIRESIKLSINSMEKYDFTASFSYSKRFCIDGRLNSEYIYQGVINSIREHIIEGLFDSCFEDGLTNTSKVFYIENAILDRVVLHNRFFVYVFMDLVLRNRYSPITKKKLLSFREIITLNQEMMVETTASSPELKMAYLYKCYAKIYETMGDYDVSIMAYSAAADCYLHSIELTIEFKKLFTKYVNETEAVIKIDDELSSIEKILLNSLIRGIYLCKFVRMQGEKNEIIIFNDPSFDFIELSQSVGKFGFTAHVLFMDIIHVLLKSLYCCFFYQPAYFEALDFQVTHLSMIVHRIQESYFNKTKVYICDAYLCFFDYIRCLYYKENSFDPIIQTCMEILNKLENESRDYFDEFSLFIYKILIDCYFKTGNRNAWRKIFNDLNLKRTIKYDLNPELSYIRQFLLWTTFFRSQAFDSKFDYLLQEANNLEHKYLNTNSIFQSYYQHDMPIIRNSVHYSEKYPWIGSIYHLASEETQEFIMNAHSNENTSDLIYHNNSDLFASLRHLVDQICDNFSVEFNTNYIPSKYLIRPIHDIEQQSLEYTYIVSRENGKAQFEKIEIVTYLINDSGKKYIVYSKNEKDMNNNEKVYISIFENKSEPYIITEIVDENEWKLVQKLFYEIANGD